GETGLELLLGEEAQRDQGLSLLSPVGHRHEAPLECPDVDPALLEEELPERLEAEEDLGAARLTVSKIDARNPPGGFDTQLPRYTYPKSLDQDRGERRGGEFTGLEVA